MRNQIFSLAFSVISAISAVGASQAANAAELTGTLKKIKDIGTITVGHRETLTPFSYYDDQQNVVGYSADICSVVINAIKSELNMDSLDVKLMPVTSATRIPLLANGSIDLECGATTNNSERRRQIEFSVTHFVTSNRFASKKENNLKTLEDLKGKTVVSVSGTTNIKQITQLNGDMALGANIIAVKDHAEALLMVQTDRAAAFVMDDVILASLIASSKDPELMTISNAALSVEPYGFMVRKDDPAFKKVVDDAMVKLLQSPEYDKLYDKWFLSPIPPRGSNLNMPMGAPLKQVRSNPTDSSDSADYEVKQ